MGQILSSRIKIFCKEKGLFLILTCLLGAFFLSGLGATPTQAQSPDPTGQNFGLTPGAGIGAVALGQTRDIKDTIAQIINIALGFLGVIAVGLIIYAGFLWLTAQGNEEQVSRAKLILRNAAIGLVIILSAWGIATFVINRLRGAAGNGTVVDGGGGGGGGGGLPAARLTLEEWQTSHAGKTSRDDVFRCSNIQTRFNQWLDVKSIAAVRSNLTAKQVGTISYTGEIQEETPAILSIDVEARNNTLRFERRDNDDPTKRINWPPFSAIEMQVPKGITNTNGQPLADCTALGCNDRGNHFAWRFTTTDKLDTTNPTLTSAAPPLPADRIKYPDRNVDRSATFTINFSEAIDFFSVVRLDGRFIPEHVKVEQIVSNTNPGVVTAIPTEHWDVSLAETGIYFALNRAHQSAQKDGPYLEPFTWYRITAKDIVDLCNNPLSATAGREVSWIFQTNGNIPGIAFSYPADKYEFACPNTETFVQFKTAMYDVKNSSCAVNPASGGLVLRGSGVEGRTLVVRDNVPPTGQGTPVNPNNFCQRYDFADTTRELPPNTIQRPTVEYRNPANDSQTNKANWSFTVKPAAECANAPYISQLSPAAGPWARCLTISGNYFGPAGARAGSDAYLHLNLDSSRNAIPAGPVGERISGNWTRAYNNGNGFSTQINNNNWFDTYLTGIVPNIKAYQDSQEGTSPISLLPPGTDGIIDFNFSVSRSITLGGKPQTLKSNTASFAVHTNEPVYQGPCLATISPNAGAWGASVVLAGTNFTATPGVASFTNRHWPAITSGWKDTLINTLVPDQSQDGLVYVEAGGKLSNGLPFDVATLAGGSCNTDSNCAPGLVCRGGQCINPPPVIVRPSGFRIEDAWPNARCANTCLDAALGFAANLDINRSSLQKAVYQPSGRVGGSVAVLKCQDPNCTTFASRESENLTLVPSPEDNKRVMINMTLAPGASYRVIVYGDAAGLRSVGGANLVNNNYDSNSAGGPDAYSWYFTLGAKPCTLARLELDKPSLGLYEGTNSDLAARGYSRPDVCAPEAGQLLNPSAWGNLNWFARQYAVGNIQDECTSSGVEPKIGDKNILLINRNSSQVDKSSVTAQAGTMAGTRALACIGTANNTIKTASVVTVYSRCKEDKDCTANGTQCNGSTCNRTGPNAGRCAPTITDVYPTSGAIGTWATVKGCYFGNQPGTVSGANSNTVFEIPLAMCGQYWANESIITEVPPALQPVEPIKITKHASEGGESALSSQSFTTDQIQHPALCRLEPSYGATGNDIRLFGKNFGSRNGATDKVTFTQNTNTVAALNIKDWSDTAERTSIKLTVPAISDLGGWDVRVVKGLAPSNPVKFNIIAVAAAGPVAPPEALAVAKYMPGDGARACPAMIVEVILVGTLDNDSLANNFYVRQSGATEPLAGQIYVYSYGVNAAGENQTRLTFVPKVLLAVNTNYQIVLKAGSSGLRSLTGGALAANSFCSAAALAQGECVIGFNTIVAGDKAAQSQCEASNLTIEPANPLYFCAGNDCLGDTKSEAGHQRDFAARLAARNGQPLQSSTPFTWMSGDTAILDFYPANEGHQQQAFTIKPQNGQTTISAATTINNKVFSAATAARVFLCENPWPDYADAPLAGGDTNFSTFYCRDKGVPGSGEDLPAMNLQVIINSNGLDNKKPAQQHTIVPGLVKEFLFTVPRLDAKKNDAIGIRVLQNTEHDSISAWYNLQTFTKGSPQAMTVDGYPGLRDGRTVYVLAPNDSDGELAASANSIYTNVYLLSLSDGALPGTQEIFEQLLANLRLTTNVLQPDNRAALRRDITRLADLRYMADIIEQLGAPVPLASGSFTPHMSVSVWPSWPGALTSDLGRALPRDPSNSLVCAPGYDQATCFNKNLTPLFNCLSGHIYQYKYIPASAPDFTLKASLEYQETSWAHPAGGRWRAGATEQCANTYYGK